MITENYVSFDTAKLLKEKGFKGDGSHFYENKKIVSFVDYWDRITPYERYCTIECPTLQMVMRWLRDVHNMYVFPFPQINTNKFWVEIYQLSNNQKWENLYCEINLQDYSFYEEACEAGIRYCLENLI